MIFRSHVVSQCLYQTSQETAATKDKGLWWISGKVACFKAETPLNTLFWNLALLNFYSKYDLTLICREIQGRETWHTIVQTRDHFPWPVWTNTLYIKTCVLWSKPFSKTIPRAFLPSHIPPCIHNMSQLACIFCAVGCHKSTLWFWTHI